LEQYLHQQWHDHSEVEQVYPQKEQNDEFGEEEVYLKRQED
jgi:hypothetical protein